MSICARLFRGKQQDQQTGKHAWGRVASTAALLGIMAVFENPSTAWATAVTNVTILEIAIDPAYGEHVFIRVSAPPATLASCATPGVYWQFTLSFTTGRKEMYAALLAAQMAGKTISITGEGTCNEWNGVESIRGFNVQS